MSVIKLSNIYKRFDNGVEALKDFSFTSNENEFVVIVGASGCGKSTILRIIAGLETATSGEVTLDGKNISNLEPKDRNVAMVFQNYALYPHMTVYENLAFPLKLKKENKAVIKKKVQEIAETLEISELLNRKPKTLSGGQKQRVAIGRAMIRTPKLFLLDEPLSNLDAALRERMRSELISLHRKVNALFLYVTHDQIEAMSMGERMIVMNDGVIQQVGTPKEIYDTPANRFVAGFIGTPRINFVSSELCKKLCSAVENLPDGKYEAGIRPEDLTVSRRKAPAQKCAEGEVKFVELLGKDAYVHIEVDGVELNACKPLAKLESTITPGATVYCYAKQEQIHFFDLENGKRVEIG